MPDAGMSEFVSEVSRLYDGMETYSYYEFLGLRRSCDYIQVKDAFYSRAQRFHPDRFVALSGETMKRAVYAVYKRMTEAYSVLGDPELRRTYDQGLDEKGDVRLSAVGRARRIDAGERKVSNTLGRLYLRSGRTKFDAGDLVGAWIDVELGLSLEEAEPLRTLHVQIVRALADR